MMVDLHSGRVTADLEGDFVVFRIGARINKLRKVTEWLPVFRENFRMLDELESDPDRGLLAYDFNPGIRNHEFVQFWRSFEDLRAYALDPDGRHAPAIGWTNEQMRESEALGIWHETYIVRNGEYETGYQNMPAHGLGKAGEIRPATGERRTAAGRLGLTDGDDVEFGEDGLRAEPLEQQ